MNRDRGGDGKVIEAIKSHFDIVDYARANGFSFRKKGNELYCNEIHGLCIKPLEQVFYNHKLEKGGDIIDFVMMFDEINNTKAVSKLRKEMGGYSPAPNIKQRYQNFSEINGVRQFTLPKAHDGPYRRVFAYLAKTRGIESKVIADMVKRKMLYEDGKYHNCVFVGYDYENKAKYASLRITVEDDKMPRFVIKELKPDDDKKNCGLFIDSSHNNFYVVGVELDLKILDALIKCKKIQSVNLFYNAGSEKIKTANSVLEKLDFKEKVSCSPLKSWESYIADTPYMEVAEPFKRGDVTGSTKEIGWFVNNNKPALFVCEAPIDVMSIMSLLELGGRNYNDYSYLAQGGAGSMKTLEYHIKNNPNISKIYLAYDNDEAGTKALSRAREMLSEIGFKGKIIDKLPIKNDFNDDLKAHIEQTRQSLQQNTAAQAINKPKLMEEQLCITR